MKGGSQVRHRRPDCNSREKSIGYDELGLSWLLIAAPGFLLLSEEEIK